VISAGMSRSPSTYPDHHEAGIVRPSYGGDTVAPARLRGHPTRQLRPARHGHRHRPQPCVPPNAHSPPDALATETSPALARPLPNGPPPPEHDRSCLCERTIGRPRPASHPPAAQLLPRVSSMSSRSRLLHTGAFPTHQHSQRTLPAHHSKTACTPAPTQGSCARRGAHRAFPGRPSPSAERTSASDRRLPGARRGRVRWWARSGPSG
jgi:hypothetical protein